MDSFKKCIAEFIGTFTLVLVGCGTAMLVGCDAVNGSGYILTAFAFGLVIVGMAYCVGNVSGCHINPAVSLACLISGRMGISDFIFYVISQVLGAISGAACLKIIFSLGNVTDKTGGLGSNGLAGVGDSAVAGLIVECLLTFIFVLVILGVTDSKYNHGSFGGVVIGFSLVMVHILGIGLTGTSVNPARSIGPALFAGGAALSSLWVFIVGPFVGAALAALIYKLFAKKD
ncbi:MAG: MIP family channel protein [Clostridiales bacterium]|jgi:aquaporin Z|nr:MIP family channel protein [Clostridiales bacterium]